MMALITMRLDQVADAVGGTDILKDRCLSLYPIWEESYRQQLNDKILRHFWQREIGAETIEMFTFNVNRRMLEVMPYYNQLYATTKATYDPLSTFDWTDTADSGTTVTNTTDGTNDSTTNSSVNNMSRVVNSEMPQVPLSGNGDYASAATDTRADTTTESTANGTAHENSTQNATGLNHRSMAGRSGSANQLLMEWRRTLLNIDMLVIDELEDCFIGVWSNGDQTVPVGPFSPTSLPWAMAGMYL